MIKPTSSTIEITSKCNLECKYCFAGSGIYNSTELPYKSIVEAIDNLMTLGNMHFLIMGGEPTLHPDFLRIIEYIKRKNAHVGFSTNGIMLSDSFCQKLHSIGISHNVYVSIDTINPITYKDITGRDRFNKVIANLANLRNNGIRYAISCVVIKQNIELLDEIYQFSCENGASFLNLIRFNVEGRGIRSKNEMGVKMDTFNAECEKLVIRYGGFRGFWGENCIIPTDRRIKSHLCFPKENDLRQFLTIRSNGDLLLGRASCGIVVGNIFKSNIINIWNGDMANRYFCMAVNDFNEMILKNVKEQNKGLL